MKHITLAAMAAVSAVVFSVASSATAATVDTLNDEMFFPANAPTHEVSGNFSGNIASVDVTDPAEFQITVGVNAVSENEVDDTLVAVMESPAAYFQGKAANNDIYSSGIAFERAHVGLGFLNAKSAQFNSQGIAVERGFASAANVSAASIAVVPLPASGLLLCFGLYGLSRMARRKA